MNYLTLLGFDRLISPIVMFMWGIERLNVLKPEPWEQQYGSVSLSIDSGLMIIPRFFKNQGPRLVGLFMGTLTCLISPLRLV